MGLVCRGQPLERARALNRAVLESHPYYAFYLTVSGRHEEAIRTVQRAVEADPTSASLSHTLSVQLSLAGRFEDGINKYRRTMISIPTSRWPTR